jgi:uncharacterized membrane protein HdeD (DUF308 family)
MSEKAFVASAERLSLIEQAANGLFILGLLVVFLASGNAALSIGSVLILSGVLGILGTLLAKHENWHTIIERLLIIGMIVGVVGMFQANSVQLYEYGFYTLGLCTLGFIVILHIPKPQAV